MIRRATLQRFCPQGKQRRPRTPAAPLARQGKAASPNAPQAAGPCSWACRRLPAPPPHPNRNAARPPPARGAGARLHGAEGIGCRLGLGALGLRALGPLGLWAFGPLGLWPLGLWAFGPLGLWAFGPLGLWAFGPLGLWAFGPLGLGAFGRVTLCPTGAKRAAPALKMLGRLLFFSYISFLMSCMPFLFAVSILRASRFSLFRVYRRKEVSGLDGSTAGA